MKDITGCELENSVYSLSPRLLKETSEKILKGIPFPYLLKESEFFHHRFYVNENVLIPRPETEALVDLIVSSGQRFEKALDIGTGSGVIILSLVRAGIVNEGTGSDISPEALRVAAINARRLRVSHRTNFIKSDRLRSIDGKFGLIVTNPPYIKKTAHRHLVQGTVDLFEPARALYLEDQEYDDWFRELFSSSLNALIPGGIFYMEGHEQELGKQADELTRCGFHKVKVLKDFAGLDRYLTAQA